MSVTVSDLRVKFSADTKDAERGIDALNNKIKNVGNDANPGNAGSAFGNVFSIAAGTAIGGVLSNAISSVVSSAINLAKGAIEEGLSQIQATVKVGLDYQQDLANIQADLANLHPNLVLADGSFDPATAAELADTVNRIALDPKLVVGFKDAAQSAQTLTRYGYDQKALNDGMLESAVLLQNAQGGQFQLASETLAKYQAIYKLKADDATKSVSEISATISVGGFRDLNDYRYALVNAVGVAQDFNISQEDINTSLAITNKLFSSGRTDGTAFRTFMERLVPTTKNQTSAMKALHLSFFDAKGAYVGFPETIGRLRNAFKGLTDVQREQYLMDIFGATGSKYARAVLSDFTDEQLQATKATIMSADATKSAAVRTDTLKAKLSNLGDQFEALRGKLFAKELQGVFVGPVEALQNLATNLGPTFEQMGQRAAAALLPVSAIVTRLIEGKGLGNFAFDINSMFGQIKVLKFGDLFGLDIGSFQFAISNGFKDITVNLSDHVKFVRNKGGTEFSIGQLFHFDESGPKTEIDLGKHVKFIHDSVKGTIDLQVGTFNTTIDLPALKSKIELAVGGVGLILQSIPDKLTSFFSSGSVSQGFSFAAADSPFLAAIKGIPTKIKEAFSSISWSTISLTFTGLVSQIGTKISGIDWSTVTTTFDTLKNRVGTLLGGIDFSTIQTTFSGFTTTIDGFNTSLLGLTASGGGLAQFQTMVLGSIQGITDSIKGIDANQVASVGLSFSGAITSVLGVFTTLSNLGNDNVGKATSAISSLVQTILSLATSFTTGLDAGKISESAGKFVASYVNELTTVLGKADLPGIAESASGLIKALSGQFAVVMTSQGPTEIGKSLGGLAKTVVTQLGAVLSDKTLTANLGQSFADIITGITAGLSNAIKAFNSADATKNVDMQGAMAGFITNFLSGVAAGLAKADYGSVVASFVGNLFKGILQGNGIMKDIQEINENGAGLKNIAQLIKDLALLGNPVGQIGTKMGEQAITATTVTVNATNATLPAAPADNSIRTANDFSTALSELNSLKPLKVEEIPTVKVDPIPPVAAPVILPPTIPPITVAQPTWLGSLLNWMPPNFGFLGGNMGSAGKNASGTDNWRGGWTWVGENGPELLNVPGGSKIVSNDNSKKMIGHMATGNYMPPAGAFMGYTPADQAAVLALLRESNKNLLAINTHTANTHKVAAGGEAAQKALRDKAAAAQLGKPAVDPFAAHLKMVEKAGQEIAKSFKGTVEELKSALQKVPGLFGSSPVTADDMQLSKDGLYKDHVDEIRRQVASAAANPQDEGRFSAQIAEARAALARIGVSASTNLKTLSAQFDKSWNDQSLFSDKKNLGLLNMDAVKASLAQQQQQAAGSANIMALFGIEPATATAQATAAGKKAKSDLVAGFTGTGAAIAGAAGADKAVSGQGNDIVSNLLGGATVTPESLAPLASSFMAAFGKALTPQKDKNGKSTGLDFGALFAGAINTSLATTTALDATGAAILAKITGSFKDVKGVDFIGGIVAALNLNLADTNAIKALNNVGQKIAMILKQGIADAFKTVDVAAAVANGVKPAAPAPVGKNASGTNSWRGGLTWVGENGPELLNPPRGSQIFNNRQSMAMAGAGGRGDTHITVNATVDNSIDIHDLAYRVASVLKRRGG